MRGVCGVCAVCKVYACRCGQNNNILESDVQQHVVMLVPRDGRLVSSDSWCLEPEWLSFAAAVRGRSLPRASSESVVTGVS